MYRNWLAHVSTQKARRIASAAFAGAPRATAMTRLPVACEGSRRAPFIERRRSNDASGFYSGARDRRMSAQRAPIPAA
jgi:hypothetical protein